MRGNYDDSAALALYQPSVGEKRGQEKWLLHFRRRVNCTHTEVQDTKDLCVGEREREAGALKAASTLNVTAPSLLDTLGRHSLSDGQQDELVCETVSSATLATKPVTGGE